MSGEGEQPPVTETPQETTPEEKTATPPKQEPSESKNEVPVQKTTATKRRSPGTPKYIEKLLDEVGTLKSELSTMRAEKAARRAEKAKNRVAPKSSPPPGEDGGEEITQHAPQPEIVGEAEFEEEPQATMPAYISRKLRVPPLRYHGRM